MSKTNKKGPRRLMPKAEKARPGCAKLCKDIKLAGLVVSKANEVEPTRDIPLNNVEKSGCVEL